MNQFKHIKVVELASVLAGPGVGQFFAELGAEVIKVENLVTGGDVTRSWKSAGEQTDDRSAYFCAINWGKRSIAIDLSKSEGQAIVHKLVKSADIVLASYKPGDAEKLGVDYVTLSKLNPALIYGEITGYGADNPKVGYDAIIQAEAGFMHMNGSPGGSSLKMPVALMDVLAGHHLKEGILLALLERSQTGKGKLVEVSLIQSAIASLVNQATNWLIGKKEPQKHGSSHPNIAPYGDVFLTKDSREFLLAVGSDQQFRQLCKILAIDPSQVDDRFSTNELRVRNRDSLNLLLQRAIGERESSELLDRLNEAKVPGGVLNTVSEALQSDAGAPMAIRDGNLFGVKSYISGINASETSHFYPPPHLGQHTEEILKGSLNFSSETIQFLKETGVVR